jgi:chromosome segregation ATPase
MLGEYLLIVLLLFCSCFFPLIGISQHLELSPIFSDPSFAEVTEEMTVAEVKAKGGSFAIFDTRGSPLAKEISKLSGEALSNQETAKKLKKQLDQNEKLITSGKKALQDARNEAQQYKDQLKQLEDKNSSATEHLSKQNKDLQEKLLEKDRDMQRLRDELFECRDKLDVLKERNEQLSQEKLLVPKVENNSQPGAPKPIAGTVIYSKKHYPLFRNLISDLFPEKKDEPIPTRPSREVDNSIIKELMDQNRELLRQLNLSTANSSEQSRRQWEQYTHLQKKSDKQEEVINDLNSRIEFLSSSVGGRRKDLYRRRYSPPTTRFSFQNIIIPFLL